MSSTVGWVGLWGFLYHQQRGKTTWGSALDGAILDFSQTLAYLVHIISRSQLYLGFGHFGWLPPVFGRYKVKLYFVCWNYSLSSGWHIIVRRAGLLLSQQDFEWRWSVPLFQCLTVLEFSFILFDLCLLITFFNFIMNYVPIVTFWIFTYHKIWILSIMFCFIWSYWIIYFLACL